MDEEWRWGVQICFIRRLCQQIEVESLHYKEIGAACGKLVINIQLERENLKAMENLERVYNWNEW